MPSIRPRSGGTHPLWALVAGLLVAAPALAGTPIERRLAPSPQVGEPRDTAPPAAPFTGAWTVGSAPRPVHARPITTPVATAPASVTLGTGGAVALLEVQAPTGADVRRPAGFTALLDVDELPERASSRKRVAAISAELPVR